MTTVQKVHTWVVMSDVAAELSPDLRTYFTLKVIDGGSEYGWGIHRMGQCYGTDGTWDYEPQPSSRTKKWLKTHRFTEERALVLAAEVAETLTLVGKTAEQLLAEGVTA